MAKLFSPLATKCTKKKCQKPICYSALFKYKKGLCSEHLAEFEHQLSIKKQKKRLIPKKCPVCKNIIKIRRNQRYCSANCRRIAMRFVEHPIVCEVTKTAIWQRVERLLRSSPWGLASVNNWGDIYHLYALLSMKKYYEVLLKKDAPLLKLKLVHLHHLDIGGTNTMQNILLVPKMNTNYKKDMNKKCTELIYNGEQIYNDKALPITTSLYKSLIFLDGNSKKCKQKNKNDLIELCLKIKQEIIQPIIKINDYTLSYLPADMLYANHFMVFNSLSQRKEIKSVIYFHLMNQFARISLSNEFISPLKTTDNHFDKFLRDSLKHLEFSDEKLTFQFFELLALAIYHNLVNGDQSFTKDIIKITYDVLSMIEKNPNDLSSKKEYLFQKIVDYINHYFELSLSTKIEGHEKFITFYNRFFQRVGE